MNETKVMPAFRLLLYMKYDSIFNHPPVNSTNETCMTTLNCVGCGKNFSSKGCLKQDAIKCVKTTKPFVDHLHVNLLT